MRRLFSFLCIVAVAGFGWAGDRGQSIPNPEQVAGLYLAPMAGSDLFRLFDPSVGIVEFLRDKPSGEWKGPAGWRGRERGAEIEIFPPVKAGESAISYRFQGGKPVAVICGEKELSVAATAEPVYRGKIPPMWEEDLSPENDPLNKKWPGRLAWPYRNPNRAAVLYASLALVGLAVLLSGRCLLLCIFGGVAVCLFAIPLVQTGSRGGLLGFAVGAFLQGLLFRNCRGFLRNRWVITLFLLVLGVALCFAGLGIGRMSRHWMDVGNTPRSAVLRDSPHMMADAPGGWGSVSAPGPAYMNWYQPLAESRVTFTLISGHLTKLVEYGWFGRFLWIFGWLAGLLFLLQLARKGGSSLPVSLWTAFCLPMFFNPVHNSWSLWLLPVASLALFCKCRSISWRDVWRVPAGAGAVLSVVVLGVFWLFGASGPKDACPLVRVDGGRVLVNGLSPKIWVVDDGETLGWLLPGKDIRYFYSQVPNAPALGYVRQLNCLPERVETLVLAGSRGADYLKLFRHRQAPYARKIVFLSPPFGPSAVPPRLVAEGRVIMVLGEFAARYADVYGPKPFPDWVGLVEGAERYIPGWVGLLTTL